MFALGGPLASPLGRAASQPAQELCTFLPGCIVNGGFEVPGCAPAGWTLYVATSGYAKPLGTVCTTTPGHSGLFAMQIADPGAGAYAGASSSLVPVGPGDAVRAAAWIRSPSPSAETMLSFYVQFFDDTGSLVGESAATFAPTATWAEHVVTATAPPGSAAVSLLFYSCAACGGTTDIDDASLVPS